ncbi:hypothetical protein [Tropicibacter naphthalenivorans]|uniref:Uncharacterized protein n=1 Tax=Tropicibacter naphthalenivorans TaxID=441103 RepID=A0A0P1GLK6_9RHOB|nr:hypothetical protein [Tropicibacter naphthalenivorans]CUH82688.1 hypothetical protein TRN7648_04231 [Tropicibacter naphthalenivorans]SMD11189.1 squid [Tropicibacter naphthalenivorans]
MSRIYKSTCHDLFGPVSFGGGGGGSSGGRNDSGSRSTGGLQQTGSYTDWNGDGDSRDEAGVVATTAVGFATGPVGGIVGGLAGGLAYAYDNQSGGTTQGRNNPR